MEAEQCQSPSPQTQLGGFSRGGRGLTVTEEGVGKVEAPHDPRKGIIGRAGLDPPLHRRHLHLGGTRLLRQLRVGLLHLGRGHRVSPCLVGTGSCHGDPHSLPTLLEGLLALSLFFPDTRLLRMRRKD